jgi:hypothetical protein
MVFLICIVTTEANVVETFYFRYNNLENLLAQSNIGQAKLLPKQKEILHYTTYQSAHGFA